VREQLKGVVLYGTGSPAYVEGYSVAGKTSTSTDDDGDHTLSFAGIAPAENPQIVVLVVLDKPEDRNLTSKVAAKTCGRIIERTLAYQGVERVLSDSDVSRLTALTKVPDVRGLTLSEALRLLNEQGFRGESAALTMGDATLVKQQWPEPGTPLHNRSLVALYPVETPDMEQVAIPDFRGRTVQEAMTLAAESGLNILIDGSCLGIVASQDPLPVQLTESNEPGTAEAEPTGGAPDDDNLTDVGTDQDKTSDDNTDEVVEKLYRGDCVEVTFIEIEEELAQNGDAE
jgi:stage V sporulation protein D (sporulation-specific penicillin-binding protein)